MSTPGDSSEGSPPGGLPRGPLSRGPPPGGPPGGPPPGGPSGCPAPGGPPDGTPFGGPPLRGPCPMSDGLAPGPNPMSSSVSMSPHRGPDLSGGGPECFPCYGREVEDPLHPKKSSGVSSPPPPPALGIPTLQPVGSILCQRARPYVPLQVTKGSESWGCLSAGLRALSGVFPSAWRRGRVPSLWLGRAPMPSPPPPSWRWPPGWRGLRGQPLLPARLPPPQGSHGEPPLPARLRP